MRGDEITIADDGLPGWPAAVGVGDVLPSRLGEAVIERLTLAIVEGRLKPGDRLPSEGQIAKSFGVSKPIAREALRELAAMGVVTVQQGKVSRVRAVDSGPLERFFRFAVGRTEQGLHDAVELRRLLEPPLARLAARRRTDAELATLRDTLARMKAALGDVPAWIAADLSFHAQVARMTHNGLAVLQMQGLEPIIREMMVRFNGRGTRSGADWRQTFERHAVIAYALEAGDAEAAGEAMQAHFAAADAAIAEIFGRLAVVRDGQEGQGRTP